MRKTWRILTWLMILAVITSSYCVIPVYADSTDDAILAKINELYSLLGNTYFTTDRQSASSSSDRSLNSAIIQQTWFKEMFGVSSLSVNQFPGSPRTYPEAKSCSGFATFAEWYIFKNSNSDYIKINELSKMNLNYSNVVNNAKVGDIISLSGTKPNGEIAGHELIFISADSTGMYVLDSNWANSCLVTKHYINYNYCTYFQIGRATNRNSVAPATYTITYNANGGYDAPSPQEKPHGQTVTLSSHWPSRAGYMFWGWGLSPDATVATYPAGGSYAKEGNVTLYAVWKPNLNLVANKAELITNEAITFSYDFSHSPAVWFCIDKDGEDYADLFIDNPKSYTRSFVDPGTYTAVVCVYNGNNYFETNAVTFVVKPNLSLTVDKNKAPVNDSITLNYDFSHSPSVWVCIDRNGQDYNDVFVSEPTSYTRSYTEPGIYTAVVCVYNGNNYYETNKVTFTVSGAVATVSQSKSSYDIKLQIYGVENTSTIIIAGYKGKRLTDSTIASYTGQEITSTLTGDIDTVKVMVWDDLIKMNSLCPAEIIPSSEFIVE